MFKIYVNHNQDGKSRVEKFCLKNGKVITNKGRNTDFTWVRSHVAERFTLIIDGVTQYEGTFFYAHITEGILKIEIGELTMIQEKKIS